MNKIKFSNTLFKTLLLIAIFPMENVFSNETTTPVAVKKSLHASLGYGIALKTNLRKNNTYSGTSADVLFNHIPLAQIGWGPVSMGAQGLSANLVGNREVGGFININRFGDRYYSTGMESRKESWFLGAGLKYRKFLFLMARDINGRSHGTRLTAHYNALYPLSDKIFTRSSAGLECFSKSFAEYYYGVRSNEVTATRPEYHAKAYCVPSASFFPGYKISEELSLLMGIALKTVSQTVRKSPTTNGDWLESSLISGVLWKF